jgi:molybdopterin-binding protein
MDLRGGAVVSASITDGVVDELKPKKGDNASSVIKATDVMASLH